MSEVSFRRILMLEAVRDGLITLSYAPNRVSEWCIAAAAPDDLRAMVAVPWSRNTLTSLFSTRLIEVGTPELADGNDPVFLTPSGRRELERLQIPASTRQLIEARRRRQQQQPVDGQ